MTDISAIEYERKYAVALHELKGASIWRSNYLPPVHRFMKNRGVRTRPPHYNPFLFNVSFMSVYFGVLWGLPMWFFVLGSSGISIQAVLFRSVLTGLFFGLLMSLYYGVSSRAHSLSDWEAL